MDFYIQVRESLLYSNVTAVSVDYQSNCPVANHDAAHDLVTINKLT